MDEMMAELCRFSSIFNRVNVFGGNWKKTGEDRETSRDEEGSEAGGLEGLERKRVRCERWMDVVVMVPRS